MENGLEQYIYKLVPRAIFKRICDEVGLSSEQIARCQFKFRHLDRNNFGFLLAHIMERPERYTLVVDPWQCRYDGPRHDRPWLKNVFYTVLVHELQHLKQRLTGMLAESCSDNRKLVVWQGSPFLIEADDSNICAYLALPWEAEADAVARRVVDGLVADGLVQDESKLWFGSEMDILFDDIFRRMAAQ